MRTLVFGGSFDPPHRGHAALLRLAASRLRPERILILPAQRSPLKATPATPLVERARLARLGLIETLPERWRRRARLELGGMRARSIYIVDELERLKARDPRGELHFICGSDAAASFPRWRSPQRLKRLAAWWYAPRPGSGARAAAHFRRLPRLHGRLPDVSSSELRSALALGRDVSRLLRPSVLARIRRHGLYGGALLARLKAALSPSRYEHTLNVAALAEALARRHGADPDKARLAGLLHDAGRRLAPPALAAYARRRRLRVPDRERLAALEPLLLHAYVSADLARREFGIRDPELLASIRRHTLGDRRMGLLDRVLYVADACSRDRSHPGAAQTRRLAFSEFDEAFRRCVADKLSHALRRGAWLHPVTLALWNSLAARG